MTQKIQKFCFFGISYSSLFMVLTIASVPIIARTHTNISFVTLFSLLTTTPFSQGFLCHHTGACQSSSYGLSTSNTHGRAIPRNHGFLEVAFAYMVGESLLQIEIFQVGSTFGETPLSLTAHWKHLWPGGKTLKWKMMISCTKGWSRKTTTDYRRSTGRGRGRTATWRQLRPQGRPLCPRQVSSSSASQEIACLMLQGQCDRRVLWSFDRRGVSADVPVPWVSAIAANVRFFLLCFLFQEGLCQINDNKTKCQLCKGLTGQRWDVPSISLRGLSLLPGVLGISFRIDYLTLDLGLVWSGSVPSSLVWSGLVWKSCFTYGFDHWDTVNNYSLVYEAFLAWWRRQTTHRMILKPACSWLLKRQYFAISSFLSSDCVMFTWFDHLEETFPSSCFLYNRSFLRRDQLTQWKASWCLRGKTWSRLRTRVD